MSRLAEAYPYAAYAIALAATNDQLHGNALELADQLERDGTTIVATRAIGT